MHHQVIDRNREQEAAELFTAVFTSSEGAREGKLIGGLVAGLASHADNEEIIGFGSCENGTLIACIFFTRLRFEEPLRVYMLAPVAVSTQHQGKGVGQALIRHGLEELKCRCVDVAVTYGDPAFYTRVGFEALTETLIQAPLPLSMPEGWLGQSLTGAPIPCIEGRPTCVAQFNDPAFW